jgi:hypothetical protein
MGDHVSFFFVDNFIIMEVIVWLLKVNSITIELY